MGRARSKVLSAVVLAGGSRDGGTVEIQLTTHGGPFQVRVWPDEHNRWGMRGAITELDHTGHVHRPEKDAYLGDWLTDLLLGTAGHMINTGVLPPP